MEKGRWEYTGISWGFGPRGVQWGRFEQKSQEEPGRGEGRGVREESPSPKILRRGLRLFTWRNRLYLS